MRRSILVLALLSPVSGCSEHHVACDVRYTLDVRIEEPSSRVDLLLMVDNSGSMAGEQGLFALELPRIVRTLASGDRDEDGLMDFEPLHSLHVGVVTSDMGGGPAVPAGMTVPSCRNGLGDDGILRTVGVTSMAGCVAAYPPVFDFAGGVDDPTTFARDVACVAIMGTGGCGFEQQLEAVLKAIAPSVATADYVPSGYLHVEPSDSFVNRPPVFAGGTGGHGDRENTGFIRHNSVLALVLLTDEEDCSVPDYSIFYRDDRFSSVGLNLRCFTFAADWLYPTRRYVENFVHLRASPSSLVYAPIVGVPTDLAADTVDGYERILADPRMIETPDPSATPPTRLLASCNTADGGEAFPPRRMVEVARGLALRGAATTVQSICASDFRPAVSWILELVGDALGDPCLPRPLRREEGGLVPCAVVEIPPAGATECRAGTTAETDLDGALVCRVTQLTESEAALGVAAPPGWFYDASPAVAARCAHFAPGQQISFSPAYARPTGTPIVLRCDLEASTDPIVSVGTFCDPDAPPGPTNRCDASPAPSSSRTLTCDRVTRACFVACDTDVDCESAGLPDWSCDTRPIREVTGDPTDPATPYGFCVSATCH